MTTPIELVQKFYAALGTGDIPTILTVLDPDLEWTEAERFPYYGGTWHSPQAVIDNLLVPLGRDWEDFSAKVDDFIAQDNRVVSFGMYSGTYRQTGHSMSSPFAHVWTARDVDDPDFAARIRERDAQALEEVVRRYLPQILRAGGGAGLAPQLAEDVAQDTFVTFIETAPRFEGRSHVRTWLFGILHKKIAEARRNLGRDNEMDDIEEVLGQRFDDAGSWRRPPRAVDAEVYDAEVRQGIDGCLDRVPTNQRMAFVFREIEGMDTQEICKILEVTRTNLGVLLHRVRNRLRECLEARGIEP